jgi:threonine/homoserine/homoserine lactone efflux protein
MAIPVGTSRPRTALPTFGEAKIRPSRVHLDLTAHSFDKYGMAHLGISSTVGPTFALFVLASLVLAVTPGPAVIYLVTRTLGQGRGAGLASIGGVALGNFANAAIASFGLATVLAVSTRAFLIVRLAGAAYLVFLGIKTLRRGSDSMPGEGTTRVPRTRAFFDGLLVALLNPKTALFFAAFLPQFVDPSGSPLSQSLKLSAVFVLIAVCTDTIYVLAADALGPKIIGFRGRRSGVRYVTAFSFIALGILVACNGSPRSAK